MLMKRLADLIRKTRLEKGLSARQVAKIAGCTARAITYIETYQRTPNIELADRILKALDVSFKIGKGA